MNRLKVLVIPSWYMTADAPLSGVFFKEQAEALAVKNDVKMLHSRVYRFRDVFAYLRDKAYMVKAEGRNDVEHIKLSIWNTPFDKKESSSGCIATKLLKYFFGIRWMPDVIHVHSVWPGGNIAFSLSQLSGIPFVITEHRTNIGVLLDDVRMRGILFGIFKAASKILAVSQGLMLELKRYAVPNEVLVIPNLIDTTLFTDTGPAESHNGTILVFVGGLAVKKGVDVLLKSLAVILREREVDIQLKIIGDGPERDALERLALQEGVGQNCSFLGYMNREETRDVIQRSDILVLPSRKETFGVVVIEAMACGKPVVVTECGGPEFIVTEASGIVVAPEDVNALARAIIHIMDNRSRYSGKNIRSIVLNKYSADVVSDKIHALYLDVIAENNRSLLKV